MSSIRNTDARSQSDPAWHDTRLKVEEQSEHESVKPSGDLSWSLVQKKLGARTIVIASDGFPPEAWAGAETVAYNHAQGLCSSGWDVTVFTSTKHKLNTGWQDYQGLRVYRVFSDIPPRLRAYKTLNNLEVVKEFTHVIGKARPEIIHCHNVHQQLSYRLVDVARERTDKVFLTAHDAMSFAYDKVRYFIGRPKRIEGEYNYALPFIYNFRHARKRYNPFRNVFIKGYLERASKVFCVSTELMKSLNQNKITNTDVIPNGIHVQNWIKVEDDLHRVIRNHELTGKKIVLLLGRMSRDKGSQIALRIMVEVIKAVPNALLLVAGAKNRFTDQMEHAIAESSLRNAVLLTGRVPREELTHYYHASDVVIVPSVYLDPFPTVNLEAMACGKPVVGTCFGGTPEIVRNGQTGFIVDPHKTEAFAEKIVTLLKNPAQARAMGEAGFRRVKREFDLKKWLRSMMAYYES